MRLGWPQKWSELCGKGKRKSRPRAFLTDSHAMKAYWGMEV